MSAAQQPAPVAPAPDPATRRALPAPGTTLVSRRPGLAGLLRASSTPEHHRRWSVVTAGACAAAALVASLSIGAHTRAATTIRDNTGPVLVTTQTLLASLAEADAAATAAFLSGADEDPTARRTHLDALSRATSQLEDVSALIGDDPETHEALKDVGDTLTRYVGLVEAARATNLAGLPVAEEYLVEAVATLSGDLAEGADRLSTASTRRLEVDADALSSRGNLAVLVLGLALVVVVVAQVRLVKRTRRLLNLPLVASGLALLVGTVWCAAAISSSQSAFDTARRDAFGSIVTTARIQADAFGANDAETIALITGDPGVRRAGDDLAAQVGTSADSSSGDLAQLEAQADTDRELARVAEARQRWGAYLDAVAGVRNARGRDQQLAAFGTLSQAFNGFTFQTEGILADNRDQFAAGLEATVSRTSGLPAGVLVLPVLAGLLALAGFQLRINEYR